MQRQRLTYQTHFIKRNHLHQRSTDKPRTHSRTTPTPEVDQQAVAIDWLFQLEIHLKNGISTEPPSFNSERNMPTLLFGVEMIGDNYVSPGENS
ncbi:hypothetical protein [Halorubrum gandharaense]